MAKLVLVNLDMNQNQLLQAVMQAGDAPANPIAGQFYYDSTKKHAYVYNGTAWELMGNVASVVDADFNASSTNAIQNKAVSTGLVKTFDKTIDSTSYTLIGKAFNGTQLTSAVIPAATTSQAGLASATDKQNIDNISNKADKSEAVKMDSLSANQTSYGIGIVYDNVDKSNTNSVEILGATNSDYGVVKLDASVTQNGANPVTGKAIYDYVGDAIAASDAMIFKGTIGTGGTVTALPTTYKTGWTYRVITAGTYAGQKCEVGDLIIALVDRDGTGNLDSDWTVAQTNIDGAITDIEGDVPISVTGSGASRTIAHKTSGVSAGSYGEGSDKTVAFGDILGIPYISVDSTGHITGAETDTITFPSNVASSSSAGLMSADAYNKLYSLVSSAVQKKTGTLATGSKVLSLPISPEYPAEIINVSITTPSGEVVVADVTIDPSGSNVDVVIAQAYSANLTVTVWYVVTE